jgi:AraC-like DNA-binding protein
MNLSLSLIEVLAFAGLFQCVSILVYLLFRAGRFALAFIPILFFLDLAAALYLDFGVAFFEIEDTDLIKMRFWLWMLLCPLSILFILQFSNLEQPLSVYGYMALVPLLALSLAAHLYSASDTPDHHVMYIAGAIGATLSLPFLWFQKGLLAHVKLGSSGQERFWMILSLIILTIVLISLTYTFVAEKVTYGEYTAIRTVIGLLFVYLSATYLFRIYPPPIRVLTRPVVKEELTEEEKKMLEQIEHKLELEKVYLEASYSRSDMARELAISESLLSRLMNQNFNDNFPSILNSYRVKEACQLLEETDAAIHVIAEEVGFNSLATFNRVFKDQMAETASKYRQKKVKEASRKIA